MKQKSVPKMHGGFVDEKRMSIALEKVGGRRKFGIVTPNAGGRYVRLSSGNQRTNLRNRRLGDGRVYIFLPPARPSQDPQATTWPVAASGWVWTQP